MAKIAAILEDMFEDAEFTKPVEKFRVEGHKVTVVDGNLVSSRNPWDIPAFVRESLKKLD